jgi:hypothetical protein
LNDEPISRAEWLVMLALCLAASLAAIAWSWRNGALLNYGDAVAHLHIARRIFDSHRPGLTQLGSVWLPLPHLLMIPFVAVYAWWANGIAGAIPSALAYIAACGGLYRLARRWLTPVESGLALAFFAINPNLLYLQTTAMTEPLFLCEMIWTVVWLVEWRAAIDPDESDTASQAERNRRANGLLLKIAAVLVAAVFTRYDGWAMALVAWLAIGFELKRRGGLRSRAFLWASALVIAAPAAWLVYNALAFGDWLTFLRGPYSAAAIEMRTAAPGWPPHPGWHNPWVSLLFFLKVAELDCAAQSWGAILLVLSVFGMAWGWVIASKRGYWWATLLWLPVPFYVYSVAYGSVPIFIPPWWPHSWYNTRYGLELLPALALALGFAAHFALATARMFWPRRSGFAVGALFAAIALNAWLVLREGPLVYVEGTKNIEARRSYEGAIPTALRRLLAERPGGLVLMNTSVYPQIVAFTGIPLRQTINESDKEFYRDALAAPAAHAALVLACDGDEIADAVAHHSASLREAGHYSAPGQPSCALYTSDTPGSTSAPAR